MKRFVSVLLAIIFVFAFGVGASARLVGDVDSDGKTNSTDALAVLRYSVGLLSEINVDYADVSGDGKVDSGDALLILQIAVGKYDGDLEIEDELVTSYKADIVDPVMATGKYTLTTEVVTEDAAGTVSIMVKDKDICVDTMIESLGGVTIRLLSLDSKTYIAVPAILDLPVVGKVGVYDEYDADINVNTGNAEHAVYVKSEYVTVDGVEYVCETYELPDGTVSEYYFKDGKWAMLSVTSNGETQTQKIVEFKKGVDESKFSLDGMIQQDLSGLFGGQK